MLRSKFYTITEAWETGGKQIFRQETDTQIGKQIHRQGNRYIDMQADTKIRERMDRHIVLV